MKGSRESALAFAPLDLEGVKRLVFWASQEGWNPGPFDSDVFYNTDPEGFYGYYHDGELIAGGSVVSYDGLFGFMGLFIVHPDYRDFGIGNKLWYQRRDLLLSRLRPDSTIGMDGVVAMQSFYAKGGFTMHFRSERHHRTGETFPVESYIEPFLDESLSEILRYDIICFGFPRERFLSQWLRLPGSFTWVARKSGHVAGYATMRKVLQGYKIGPLFADTPKLAEALYRACLASAPHADIYIDVPVVNSKAIQMVKKHNTKYVFECGRMYYGVPTPLPIDNIFGITTFELG